jgi:hypothetical protein
MLLVSVFLVLAGLTLTSLRETALNRRLDNLLKEEIEVLGPQVELAAWEIVENDPNEGIKLEVQVRSNHDIELASVVELQNRLALALIVIPTTTLNPIVSPTQTPEPAVE